jgi:hypothetical protein
MLRIAPLHTVELRRWRACAVLQQQLLLLLVDQHSQVL